jgi:hypothetical protein
VAGQWFSPGTLVSSTNKTDHHDITEILLKVTLNTTKTNKQKFDSKLYTTKLSTCLHEINNFVPPYTHIHVLQMVFARQMSNTKKEIFFRIIQSVPIPSDVVSLNLDQGEVYNIM